MIEHSIQLAPSILAADFAHLADQVDRATAGGASVIHVDIMDGHFVPNLTVGPPVVKSLRRATQLPLDCHLASWTVVHERFDHLTKGRAD